MPNLFLLIVSGALMGLAFDHPVLVWLAWLGFVPAFFARKRTGGLAAGLKQGFVFGLAFYSASVFWVANISRLSWVGWAGYLAAAALILYLSLYPALFFGLAGFFLRRPLAFLSLPALWVLMEFLQENIWAGWGWTSLGHSQHPFLYLIQPADLGGARFISFLIVMVNVLILDVFLKKAPVKKIAAMILVPLACCGYGAWRLNSLKPDSSVKLTILQANIAEADKSDPSAGLRLLARLDALVAKSDQAPLVIFPEAGWPFGFSRDSGRLLLDFARDLDRDLLVGTVKDEGKSFFNSALLVDRQGRQRACYRKIKIVPFGEYIPMRRFLGFIPAINNLGDMSPGKEETIFPYAGKRFGVLICFEDTFTLSAARLSARSDFLINITNDEWFRGEPQATQHFGIMSLRAVENRVSIARSANTGISGWTDFCGRQHKLELSGRRTYMEGVWTIELPMRQGGSFYRRFPWAFTLACALFLLILSPAQIKIK